MTIPAFTESHRYIYPLTPDSLVIDAGGYEGNFANIIHEKYGCTVLVLEPVPVFCDAIKARFINTPGIKVLNVGLGPETKKEFFGIQGGLTGIANGSDHKVQVQLISPTALLELPWCAGRTVALLKLNIEGLECDVLDAVLDAGIECRFEHIQVQFHSVIPFAAQRRAGIRNRLLMNFRLTSEDPDMDTGWSLFALKS